MNENKKYKKILAKIRSLKKNIIRGKFFNDKKMKNKNEKISRY